MLRTNVIPALLLMSTVWPAVSQTPSGSAITTAIVGGQVLDGSGAPPIPDGVVLIQGSRIAAVGAAGTIPIPPDAKIIQAGGMTVMPGLIDMHVHLSVIGSSEGTRFVHNYLDRQEQEIMPAGARQYLMNGVTTVRDLGSPLPIVNVRDRINRGELVGARLFVAGPMLQKRGSVDMLDRSWLVTGPEDAREKVRRLVAANVDWIKVHDQSNFSDDELTAIADEASKAHKPMCGHAYQSDAEVVRGIRFHFKTLEHTGIGRAYEYSDATIQAIIGSDTCIDPTLVVRTMSLETERFPARIYDQEAAAALPADLYEHLVSSLADYEHIPTADVDRRWSKNTRRKMEPLIRGGACIVVGTDNSVVGLINGSTTWYEVKNFVDLGMTPMEAIEAATSRPGHLLAPDIGTLRPGFRADVILVKGDVLADVGLLQNVSHVLKDGVQYK
ncbi:MAG TPA: amidohydrolase family protein [Bryobacteraceae bacterium]|nr:amidohydrolase family protein [Bryobacteraceae bacterium]